MATLPRNQAMMIPLRIALEHMRTDVLKMFAIPGAKALTIRMTRHAWVYAPVREKRVG